MKRRVYIFAWASAGGFVGDMLHGPVTGLLCFAIAGYLAAWRVTRRH